MSSRASAPSAQLRLRSGAAQLVWPATGGAAAVAAALTIRARDRGGPVVEHQVLIHPRLRVAPVRETQLAGVAAATAIGGDEDSRAYLDGLRRAGVGVWQLDDAELPQHLAAVLRPA